MSDVSQQTWRDIYPALVSPKPTQDTFNPAKKDTVSHKLYVKMISWTSYQLPTTESGTITIKTTMSGRLVGNKHVEAHSLQHIATCLERHWQHSLTHSGNPTSHQKIRLFPYLSMILYFKKNWLCIAMIGMFDSKSNVSRMLAYHPSVPWWKHLYEMLNVDFRVDVIPPHSPRLNSNQNKGCLVPILYDDFWWFPWDTMGIFSWDL